MDLRQRMLNRASSRRNLNGAVIDTSSQHLRRKYSVLRAIDDVPNSRREGDDRNTIGMHYNAKTMKIGTEGNNVSIISSLSAAIDDLDIQINSLGITKDEIVGNKDVIPTCNQIYPTLMDIKFDTTRKNNEDLKITKSGNNGVEIYETPKATRRHHKPNLESTRKSIKQELNSKMSSPPIETTISTIQLIDSPAVHGEESPQTTHPLGTIPDEVEKFLQNALGDEFHNSTGIYTDSQHVEPPNINASEIISENRAPFYRRIRNLLCRHGTESKDDSGLSPPKTSETFDRTTRFYRSLSQRIKKKLRSTINRHETETAKTPLVIRRLPDGPIDGARGQQIENLLRQVRIQQTIISQATKALEVCHSHKEFIGSPEEVESQRLLLLAYLRKRVMMEELKNLSSPDQQDMVIQQEVANNAYGEVHISNIQLTLRKGLHEKPRPGEIREWFVVVVFEGMNVWATHPVPCPIDNLTIDFGDFRCEVKNQTPKLKITLEVYVLKLVTGFTYQHEQKYHITNIKLQTRTCPSPTKFLKKVERPLSPRTRPPILLSSSFTPSGYVDLFLSDLILVSPWPLSAVPSDSMLLGTIDFKLSSRLHLPVLHQGFLNNGEESGGFTIWNRRWCVMRGQSLMFWNYPREQEDKQPPLLTIELINCVSDKIAPVNRSLCAKPRTLLIEIMRKSIETDQDSRLIKCRQGFTIVRHLLSCDTTRELVDWMSKLNHALSVLRAWNLNTANSITSRARSKRALGSEL